MKIKVNIEQNGHEVLSSFIEEAKKNNIDVSAGKIQIFVKSKDGKEIDITPDRLRIVFDQQ